MDSVLSLVVTSLCLHVAMSRLDCVTIGPNHPVLLWVLWTQCWVLSSHHCVCMLLCPDLTALPLVLTMQRWVLSSHHCVCTLLCPDLTVLPLVLTMQCDYNCSTSVTQWWQHLPDNGNTSFCNTAKWGPSILPWTFILQWRVFFALRDAYWC